MRIRSVLAALLIAALLLGLSGCGLLRKSDPNEGFNPSAVPPDGTRAPETAAAPALPQPKGADSVKTLLEKSLDYFHSGCDYSRIEAYHDRQAYLAWFLMQDLYRDQDLDLAQAMEKAALLFGSAEALQEKDPELARLVMEEFDAIDPEEALTEYMNNVREAFRSGEITKDNPNYDKFAQMLTDWDKGVDYILEHYPEIFEHEKERGLALGLEGTLEQLQRWSRFELYNSEEDNARFKDLECDYRPENTYVDPSGVCSYQMGTVEADGAWSVDMMYYVKDGLYYLIGYSYVVGGLGG